MLVGLCQCLSGAGTDDVTQPGTLYTWDTTMINDLVFS